jgi:hypothetical protein
MIKYTATYLHCEGGLREHKTFNAVGCELALEEARDRAPLDSWLVELVVPDQEGLSQAINGKTVWKDGKPVWHMGETDGVHE